MELMSGCQRRQKTKAKDLLITARPGDKDGNLIEHSTRAGHGHGVIVIPQVMEHERQA